ncbi:MAG: mechanosensitive ion channel family protein [Patescibacteria group bacterium]|nr:mechanosensitive ion channel family protein [Patescibacteria group bacterium]
MWRVQIPSITQKNMTEKNFQNKIIVSAMIIFLYFFFSFLIKKLIDKTFAQIKNTISKEKLIAKTQTIKGFLKNVVDFALFIILLLMILSLYGINILPILTGAGVLGLAISFGSQTLIKDLISGFFILVEDQFNVGDHIQIGAFEGEVKKITMRMIILKDKNNNLIYIPNSQINTVVKITKNKK